LPSGVRRNAFWFMALVFSRLAAFLAILVQQWVRDCLSTVQWPFEECSTATVLAGKIRKMVRDAFGGRSCTKSPLHLSTSIPILCRFRWLATYCLFQESWHEHKWINFKFKKKDKKSRRILNRPPSVSYEVNQKLKEIFSIMDREWEYEQGFAGKNHPRRIGDTSAEPQKHRFRLSHILTLGP